MLDPSSETLVFYLNSSKAMPWHARTLPPEYFIGITIIPPLSVNEERVGST